MQAPRNWRTKVERYRLAGSENQDGETSIVKRPDSLAKQTQEENLVQPELLEVTAA